MQALYFCSSVGSAYMQPSHNQGEKGIRQPELMTQRLLLRCFNLDDASEVQELAGNLNVSKTTLTIPYPYEFAMAEEWIGTHQEKWESKTGLVYAIAILG